jgi:hypothetical protein
MPLPTTFAGDSARGEGLFASMVSLGGNYWSATLTDSASPPSDQANGIALDSSGNVYVVGRVAISGGGSQLSLSKYNSSGVIQWQKTFTGLYSITTGLGLNIDSSGNIYACGVENTFPFQQLITKWDNSGTLQWAKNLTDTYKAPNDSARAITFDASGNVYVAGFGLDTNGALIMSISKWNSSGTIQWQKAFFDPTATPNSAANGIALDSSGNIYVVGYGLISSGSQAISISQWNNSGTLQWQRTLKDAGATPTGYANAITLDSSGNIYICGSGDNSSNNVVLSVSKWNSSGTIQWQSSLTDAYSSPITSGYGIALDSSGNVYVCGQGRNSSGAYVTSISKWNNSGTIQFQRTITDTYSSPSDLAQAITVDGSGNMYIAGSIKNSAGNQVMSISKLPTDGSRTGTYTSSTFGITYATSSWTASTTSWTAATSSFNYSTPSWTVATSNGASGTSTFTTDKVTM